MKPFVYAFTVLRALGGFIFVPVLTFLTSSTVIAYGMMNQPNRDEKITYHMWLWSRLVNWYFGVHVLSDGFEKLPLTGGGVLAFNHQSHFDIPAITGSSLRWVRYGAKIELFSIPAFGSAIRTAGMLPITRDNRREVFRIYQEAMVKFRHGIFFALAPEGTRQSEPMIGRFKKGPFIFAANSGVPVFPVVIEGADRVLGKGDILVNLGCLRRTIRVRVLDPIFPIYPSGAAPTVGSEPIPPEVASDLLDRTYNAISAEYAKLRASL